MSVSAITVFSEVRRISETCGPDITVGEITEGLGKRAYGVILFVLCLPNCIPGPPGIGSVFGLAMLAVAIQYLLGRDYPVLPGFIARRRIGRDTLKKIVNASGPFMRRLERVIRPRQLGSFQPVMEYGGMCVLTLLCFVILIPLPLTNMMPAMGCAVLAASIAERDAIGIATGLALGGVGAAIAAKAAYAVFILLF